MDFSLSGTVLTRDLFSADGRLVASRGEIVDLGRLKDAAAKAPRGERERPLFETTCAEAVLEAFEAPALQHMVGYFREQLDRASKEVLSVTWEFGVIKPCCHSFQWHTYKQQSYREEVM